MKSIKKITNKVTDNFSALAGSALLVGATLTGGAALASAQSGSSGSSMDADLADYPTPFVDEDGNVETSIVLGSDAKVTDVVGATEIAGSLGAAAFGEESVSTGSGVSGTWAADNGVTLNRDNTNLFLYEGSGDGITRIDDQDISVLETTSFQSADSNDVEVEHDVRVEDQSQQFEAEGDYDDPILHLNNPASVSDSEGEHLFSATAEFSDSVDFEEAGDNDDSATNADEYIEDGDTVELFGTEYTFSDDSNSDELVLYGSSDRVEVNTGESTTLTVDGEEVTAEATYVSEGDSVTATVSVGGETETVEEGDSVGPNGNIRVSDIYRTGPDGQGRVAFSQGSDELTIDQSSNEVQVDGEELDGVYVTVDGGDFTSTEAINFYFGAQDNDESFIEQGETYEDPLFGLEFHYGGLNPDTADEDNAAETIEVTSENEGVSEVTFTTDGEEATVPVHTDSSDTDDDESVFGDEDGTIAQYEGEAVEEDDRVVLNAYEEADMYEVTDVSDSDLGTESDGELSVTLENVVTGESVTVEEDGLDLNSGDSDVYDQSAGTATLQDESIEGKDFHVTFEDGEEVSFVRSTADGNRQLWPAMYTATDSAIAFDAPDTDVDNDGETETGIEAGQAFDVSDHFTATVGDGLTSSIDLSSDDVEITIGTGDLYEVRVNTTENSDGSGASSVQSFSSDTAGVTLTSGEADYNHIQSIEVVNATDVGTVDVDQPAATDQDTFDTSTTTETADIPSGVVSNDATATLTFTGSNYVSTANVDSDFAQYNLTTDNGMVDLGDRSDDDADSAVLFTQPENDQDEEEAYVLETKSDDSEAASVASYSGFETEDRSLEDEDVTVNYDEFGAYVSVDDEGDDEEVVSINMPSGQATSGFAMTGADGALSADGSSGGSATAAAPTGQYASGVLADDGNVGQVKNNDNLILVGGPNANSLTQELVDDNQTMPAGNYTTGQGMIQMVDGFSEGQSALVVAGATGEDTRAAADFLADYRNNQDALEGQSKVTVETSSGTVVE
ncbi:S-layer protein [Candidatus Nanohalobium constans]|uniref:S-layer protein outer domain-containing protein n=1 Tax=Candidatus Nanohalobium constans TaxID=2565781 RepID=A0A5Q0UGZ7_9ARCH|nr:S-layer protein [Candidatus Nanohalobium constans]QGA80933.1 hypothetical protein LC1Nh_1061 [Candidatus Nanohalobium constans]